MYIIATLSTCVRSFGPQHGVMMHKARDFSHSKQSQKYSGNHKNTREIILTEEYSIPSLTRSNFAFFSIFRILSKVLICRIFNVTRGGGSLKPFYIYFLKTFLQGYSFPQIRVIFFIGLCNNHSFEVLTSLIVLNTEVGYE